MFVGVVRGYLHVGRHLEPPIYSIKVVNRHNMVKLQKCQMTYVIVQNFVNVLCDVEKILQRAM